MPYGRFIRTLGLAILVLSTGLSCGTGAKEQENPFPSFREGGVVELPVADAALHRQLVVNTWMGRFDLDRHGRFDAEFPAIEDNRLAFVAPREHPRSPLFYGYYFPAEFDSELLRPFVDRGRGLVIDARSTALTMVLVNPLLLDSSVEQRAMVAEEALQHDQFDELAEAIRSAKAEDPLRPIRYGTTPELFHLSSRITIDSLRTIAARLPDSPSASFAPQGDVSYDYDMAYPQNEDGSIVVYNPKLIYYVGAYRDPGVESWDYGDYEIIYFEGKERWLDVSIFPPKVETVPPTQTDGYSFPGAQMLSIWKGFQFDYPFETLWETPPAKLAMIGNVWLSWNMMIALAGDISVLLNVPAKGVIEHVSQDLVDGSRVESLWNTVETRDRLSTVDSMYDVFTAMLPSIRDYHESYIKEKYDSASGEDGLLDQVGTIFEGVWALVSGGSIVNSIIDVTTESLPFYYDLFTAHSHAVYPIYDDQIQSLPDSPTISRVAPQQVVNGRTAIVYGFDFGVDWGHVVLTGSDGAAVTDTTVYDWQTGKVTIKVPSGMRGFGDGDQKMITVQVAKASSGGATTYTNAVDVPFKRVTGGGGGGGGDASSLPPVRRWRATGFFSSLPCCPWRGSSGAGGIASCRAF